MKTITIQAIEFDSAGEAIQYSDAAGRGKAVRLNGRNYVVEDAEAVRLAAAGAGFAYLGDQEMPDGTHRIVTIPVND